MTDIPPVSANVRAEIARRHLHGTGVAAAIGMPRSTYQRRMTHPEEWRLGELAAVADYLGIEVAVLVRRAPINGRVA